MTFLHTSIRVCSLGIQPADSATAAWKELGCYGQKLVLHDALGNGIVKNQKSLDDRQTEKVKGRDAK